ncbi:hypothetical protein [Streptomyces albipurpureus]|uniref:Uncharacterized protein n=1 Tax=Streptomyces albipurpureus TaxID=2897419 RepID=A0ABT0UUV1_9ACTN|nr:hypothetical protein [Streptomyces sp. CWNU-1]MCM2391749.1 hypothetical protein [Streptomyces sp. CWNU-1]
MTDTLRRFKDCDGDTWEEYEPGWLKLVERANGKTMFVGSMVSIEDVASDHGPLTEVRPDVDVRALLADVLVDLAEVARSAYWEAVDPVEERVFDRLSDMFSGKSRELRSERA